MTVSAPQNRSYICTSDHSDTPLKVQRVAWGIGGEHHHENSFICRICEVEIPTVHVEEHSRICTIADRCDLKGLSVNERLQLDRVAETLERILETWTPKGSDSAVGSPEVSIVSTSSASEELDDFSPQRHSLSRRFSEDMLNYIPEVDTAFSDSLSPEMSCETHGLLTPKKASSQGSLTPRSPLLSPRTNQIEFLLSGRRNISEHESYDQICTILFSWCWPCPCSSTSGDIFLEN